MSLINSNHVFIDKEIETKIAALEFLAATAQSLQVTTDSKKVFASFQAREAEGSTGMMDGFAIPHAKSPAIKEVSILIVKTKKGIEWDSLDGQPIKIIIALLIPETEAGTTHLKLLSKIARLLMKSEFKEQLERQQTAEELADYVNQKLTEE